MRGRMVTRQFKMTLRQVLAERGVRRVESLVVHRGCSSQSWDCAGAERLRTGVLDTRHSRCALLFRWETFLQAQEGRDPPGPAEAGWFAEA